MIALLIESMTNFVGCKQMSSSESTSPSLVITTPQIINGVPASFNPVMSSSPSTTSPRVRDGAHEVSTNASRPHGAMNPGDDVVVGGAQDPWTGDIQDIATDDMEKVLQNSHERWVAAQWHTRAPPLPPRRLRSQSPLATASLDFLMSVEQDMTSGQGGRPRDAARRADC